MNAYLELSEGSEHKFYAVELHDMTITIRYGRIGTDGTSQTKVLPSPTEAQAFAEKKLGEKRKKGYADAVPGQTQKKAVEKPRIRLPKPLQPYREVIENSLKPCIELRLTRGESLPWNSKVGGIPYRLLGQAWPSDPKGKPLQFLAQINFTEMPDLEGFPKSGLLQFFIGTDDLSGCRFEVVDNPVQDTYRVIYHPEIVLNESLLERERPVFAEKVYGPIDQDEEYHLTGERSEMPIDPRDRLFNSLIDIDFLQDGDSPDEDLTLGEYLEEQYNEITKAGHLIGGYPTFTQEDPRTPEQPHILLFQLDTDEGVMWGDSGVGNFFIHPDDLARRDFSRVSYNWDCC